MEIILQWLDDFEDIVFSLALTWERQRLRLLQAGLAASIVVLAIEMADVQSSLAPTFTLAALGSVGIWFTGSMFASTSILSTSPRRIRASRTLEILTAGPI